MINEGFVKGGCRVKVILLGKILKHTITILNLKSIWFYLFIIFMDKTTIRLLLTDMTLFQVL